MSAREDQPEPLPEKLSKEKRKLEKREAKERERLDRKKNRVVDAVYYNKKYGYGSVADTTKIVKKNRSRHHLRVRSESHTRQRLQANALHPQQAEFLH